MYPQRAAPMARKVSDGASHRRLRVCRETGPRRAGWSPSQSHVVGSRTGSGGGGGSTGSSVFQNSRRPCVGQCAWTESSMGKSWLQPSPTQRVTWRSPARRSPPCRRTPGGTSCRRLPRPALPAAAQGLQPAWRQGPRGTRRTTSRGAGTRSALSLAVNPSRSFRPRSSLIRYKTSVTVGEGRNAHRFVSVSRSERERVITGRSRRPCRRGNGGRGVKRALGP